MLPKELEALLVPDKKRTAAETKQLRDHYVKNVFPEERKRIAVFKQIDRAKMLLDGYRGDVLPRVMVMSDDQPRETNILDRGAYLAKKEKVSFDAPGFLPPLPKDAPKNRLGLAQWLFRPEHPLTARVQVNRQWQHFFGFGIVRTSEDLGVQSDRPTAPGAARLALGRVPRIRLEDQDPSEAHRDQQDLPSVQRRHQGPPAEGPREQAARPARRACGCRRWSSATSP
jgi:hypothetical protein